MGRRPGEGYEKYEDSNLIARDIPHCEKGHYGGFSAELFINFVEKRGKSVKHKRSGGPEFHDFPSFLSGAHQQMHITQIRRAYDGGLRLMPALAVHNWGAEYLTSQVEDGRVKRLTTELDVLRAQVCAMTQLAEINSDWMQIAYSPDEARNIIRDNKLAVVLGVEMDQLGELGVGTLEEEVKYLWDLGVRQVFPVHAVDNRLAARVGIASFSTP